MRTRGVKAIPDDVQPHVQPHLLSLPFMYPLLQQNGRCVLLISIFSCVYILFSVWRTLPLGPSGQILLVLCSPAQGLFHDQCQSLSIEPHLSFLRMLRSLALLLHNFPNSAGSLQFFVLFAHCLFPSVEWKLPEGKHSLIYVHAIEPRTSFYTEKGSGLPLGIERIKDIHNVVQSSRLSNSRTFHHPSQKLYTLNNNSPSFPPPAPGSHHSTFRLCEFTYSNYLIQKELYSICPFVSGLFYLA